MRDQLITAATITKQFQEVQQYNYLKYIDEINKSGLFGLPLLDMGVYEKKRTQMTYGEYKRQQKMVSGRESVHSDSIFKRSGSSKKPVDNGWSDEFSREATTSNGWDNKPATVRPSAKPTTAHSDWDEFTTPKSSDPQKVKKTSDDADCNDLVPKARANQKCVIASKKNNWSDVEAACSKARSDDRSSSREGSVGSRNSSDSRNFSRGGLNSFRGRGSRESSRDQHFEKRPEGIWNCMGCKRFNNPQRTECYYCHIPKGEVMQDRGNSSRGGYRGTRDGGNFKGNDERKNGGYQRNGDRDCVSSYRGRGGGGYRGRNDSNSWRGGRNNSIPTGSGKPVASGWSDDEGDKPKEKVAKAPISDDADDWATLSSSLSKGQSTSKRPPSDAAQDQPDSKKQAASSVDDDWSFLNENVDQSSNTLPSSVTDPIEIKTDKTDASKAPQVDNGAVPNAQNGKPQSESKSQKAVDDDEWAAFTKPNPVKEAGSNAATDHNEEFADRSAPTQISAVLEKPAEDEWKD